MLRQRFEWMNRFIKENDKQKEPIAQLQKENAEQKKTIRLLQKENTEQKKLIVRQKQFIEVLEHRPLQADYILNVREKAIEQVEIIKEHQLNKYQQQLI